MSRPPQPRGDRLPLGWDAARLRFISTLNPSKREVRGLRPDHPVSFVPMEAVGEWGGLRLDETKPIGEVATGYTFFSNGDVVVAKVTPCFENGKGALAAGLTGGVAFGTTELHVLRAGPRIERRFLFYLTESHPFRAIGASEMYGAGGQKRVPEWFFRDFLAPVPPLGVQRAIADFLDRKTAVIDALIAKKEQLSTLIRERRRVLAAQCVTRGLSSRGPLRPSGIDWMGDIPAHWEVLRTRRVCSLTTGTRDTQDAVPEGTYPFFVRSQNVERIDSYSFDGEGVLTAGDGVGSVAKVFHYYVGKFEFHQRMYLYYGFTRVLGRHYYYFLREWLAAVAKAGNAKITVDSLRRPMLMDFPVTVPPVEEQRAIVAFLDSAETEAERARATLLRQIEKLQEYRQALITAAVTGQLDIQAQPEVA